MNQKDIETLAIALPEDILKENGAAILTARSTLSTYTLQTRKSRRL